MISSASAGLWQVLPLSDPNNTAPSAWIFDSEEADIGLAFSPDNRLVARGNLRNTARVFEAATGKELLRLAHQGIVSSVAFSPDGRWLATGSHDKTARVFEVSTGEEIFRLPHQGPVRAVVFSPDGQSLFIASASRSQTGLAAGLGLILDHHYLNPAELIQEVCSRLFRNLTPAQWKQYLGDEPYHKTCPNLPIPTDSKVER